MCSWQSRSLDLNGEAEVRAYQFHDSQSAALRRDAAVMAARIGLVRGDLWSEAASAYGEMPGDQDKNALKR